jgi:carboxypeptidase C (cathepsin A)
MPERKMHKRFDIATVCLIVAALFVLLAATPTFAQQRRPGQMPFNRPQVQEQAGQQETTQNQPKENPLKPSPPSVTKHSITIGGKTLNYTATVGFMNMRDEKGKLLGYMYYTAYVKDGEDPTKRPLTFAFNGGPGTSSCYLHLLLIGPRRALLAEDGNTLPPPPKLVDNEYTWLRFTDIVMIDPLATGFSRAEVGIDYSNFLGVQEDANSVADFIRLFISENNRWISPIFIAGESYGGVRGSMLANVLQQNNDIKLNVNGIIFISPAYDMDALHTWGGSNLSLALYFPTYATTAWYHKKLAPEYQNDFDRLVKEAKQFALYEYLPALIRGSSMSDDEMRAIAEKMAKFTGLSVDYLMEQKLRVNSIMFREELLKAEHKGLDRLDARFEDGAYELTTTLSPVLHNYLKNELGYDTLAPYSISANISNFYMKWNWGDSRGFGGGIDVVASLAETMNNNRSMKVFAAEGYYDYACPFFTIEYSLNQMLLKPGVRDNITQKVYHAGHMVYTPLKNLAEFTEDVKNFINSASNIK